MSNEQSATERAIALLECYFRESDNNCKNVDCENASPLCKIEREAALETALDALREKAEREKGCEFCNRNPYGHGEAISQLIYQVFNDKAHIHTYLYKNSIHTLAIPSPEDTTKAKQYSACKLINHCPMCGRKLEATL